MEVIASDCEVILEITGHPEHGTQHALAAIEAGKHIVMVTVEADCLVEPVLRKKAAEKGVVYSLRQTDRC